MSIRQSNTGQGFKHNPGEADVPNEASEGGEQGGS